METSDTRKHSRKNFTNQLDRCWSEMYKLLLFWEELEEDDHDGISDGYPFIESYDEWLFLFSDWIEKVKLNFANRFHPTLSVGQLKRIINNLDDSTQIVISKPNHVGWLNIEALEVPNEDHGIMAMVIHPKDNFSEIQF